MPEGLFFGLARRVVWAGVVVLVMVTVVVAAGLFGGHRQAALASTGPLAPYREPSVQSTASSHFTLLTEPTTGLSRAYSLLNGAKRSIDVTMYELADSTAEVTCVRLSDRDPG